MQPQQSKQCQLCQREMTDLTVHHLVPRQTVKRKQADAGETIEICAACHKQIHSFYSNLELARELNTVEKLQSEPKMRKFLNWIGKQKPEKKIKVIQSM
jgi:5-methylcytosine-specific restriction endonuclease McrA